MSGETERAKLRPMLPADGPVLAAIFQASIETLAAEDYDEEQVMAWASVADDEAAFAARLGKALTLVATIGGAAVGFLSLEDNARIEMLYVYPAAARCGVATLLVDAAEKIALGRGAKDLSVESSDTARPLFEKLGYEPQVRQTVTIGDVWFGNTRMRKTFG